jgi:hypothetical protein
MTPLLLAGAASSSSLSQFSQFGLPIRFLAQLVYHPHHLPSIPCPISCQSNLPVRNVRPFSIKLSTFYQHGYPQIIHKLSTWMFGADWGFRDGSLYTLRPRRFRARIFPAFPPANLSANPGLPPSNPPKTPPNPPNIAIFIVTSPRAGLDAQ